jgi:hypothetical protein
LGFAAPEFKLRFVFEEAMYRVEPGAPGFRVEGKFLVSNYKHCPNNAKFMKRSFLCSEILREVELVFHNWSVESLGKGGISICAMEDWNSKWHKFLESS